MTRLEGAYEQISERLGGIDGRLAVIDQKIDTRLDALDRKIDTSQWRLVSLTVGTWITLMLTIIGAIFTSHHP